MSIKGTIPKEIVYVFRDEITLDPPKTVDTYDDMTFEKGHDGQKVFPTWVVEEGNIKTILRAVEWAEKNNKTIPVKQIKMQNAPIEKVQIVGINKRYEGGRAWKVIIDDKYYVDLREGSLMEILFDNGIKKSAICNKKLVWAKIGSELKLISVDSLSYKEIKKLDDDKAKKPTKEKFLLKNLVPGSVYSSKKMDGIYLFIGFAKTQQIENEVIHSHGNMQATKGFWNPAYTKTREDILCQKSCTGSSFGGIFGLGAKTKDWYYNNKANVGMFVKTTQIELDNIIATGDPFENHTIILKQSCTFDTKLDYNVTIPEPYELINKLIQKKLNGQFKKDHSAILRKLLLDLDVVH